MFDKYFNIDELFIDKDNFRKDDLHQLRQYISVLMEIRTSIEMRLDLENYDEKIAEQLKRRKK